jgi:hypothetical protein
MSMSPELQFLLQEILTDVRAIRTQQTAQQAEIVKLRTLAGVVGAASGGLVTLLVWIARKTGVISG